MIGLLRFIPIGVAVAAVLGGLGFNLWREFSLKEQHKSEIAQLNEDHKNNLALVHAAYRLQGEQEEVRQRDANLQALQAAAAEKEQADADLASLRAEFERLKAGAGKDAHAKRPALSIDAVRRLNTLRGRVRTGS